MPRFRPIRVAAVPVFLLLLLLSAAAGRGASLVRDLRTGSPSFLGADSHPRGFTRVGDKVYFRAYTPATEFEIWVTDGTSSGTRLLLDLCPGSCGAGVAFVGAVGDALLWLASIEEPENDFALWRTDGTGDGTIRLTPPGTRPFVRNGFEPGSSYGFPRAPDGAELFFGACSDGDVEPCQLWATDGTPGGTRPLNHLLGLPSGAPGNLTPVGDKVFFMLPEPGGSALWATDGTRPGTVRLVSGSSIPSPSHFTPAGQRLYFLSGREVWTSDGTSEGTLPVVSFGRFDALDFTGSLQTAGERLYFAVRDETVGDEIWTSDGTPEGTRRVTDFAAEGPFASNPINLADTLAVVGGGAVVLAREPGDRARSLWLSLGDSAPPLRLLPPEYVVDPSNPLVDLGDRAVFVAYDDGGFNKELWLTDGTVAGTRPVSPQCEACSDVAALRGHQEGSAAFLARGHVWITDGSAGGTRPVTAALPGLRIGPFEFELVELGGRYLFPAEDGRGEEPWISDGTTSRAGTRLLADVNVAAPSSNPFFLRPGVGGLVFSACDGVSREVWTSDGTEARTRRLTPMRFDVTCSDRDEPFPRPVVLGETVFFFSHPEQRSAGRDQELWRSDGTAPGTFRLLEFDFFRVPASELVAFQGQILFAVSEDTGSSSVRSFWRTDGTRGGTSKVLPAPEGEPWEAIEHLHAEGDAFYFVATGHEFVQQVWRSDGTAAGTWPLTAFTDNQRHDLPQFTAFDGELVFVSPGEDGNHEVWRSDGTPGSAAPLADVVPGPVDSYPTDLLVHDGALYFFADTPDERRALYRSDGTAGGTIPVRSFVRHESVGAPLRRPRARLTSFGGALYFAADDGEHGVELWRSEGTAETTHQVADLHPGPIGSSPTSLTPFGGSLHFVAHDPALGQELWTSDGTAAGTAIATDVAPGAFSSFPTQLTVAAGELFFTADDGFRGRELWRLGGESPPPPPAGPWLASADIPDFRFKVRIGEGDGARDGTEGADCIAETLCVEGAVPERAEVFIRMVGPKPNGLIWPTLVKFSTSRIDLWIEQESTGLVRHYVLAGTAAGQEELPGRFDREGFLPGPGWTGVERRLGTPALPLQPDEWFTSAEFPGFRFRLGLSDRSGGALPVRLEDRCLQETVCLSGSVPGRSELFLRIVGPKPNGRLWPTLVRFTTSTVDVWIEQVATGETRHYRLEGAGPGSSDLTGRFDREGFVP